MKFEEAYELFKKGKKIRVMQKEQYKLKQTFEIYETFNLRWEVIEENPKTFIEIFDSFKNGKKIRRKKWTDGQYFQIKSNCYGCYLDADDLIGYDWEVVE